MTDDPYDPTDEFDDDESLIGPLPLPTGADQDDVEESIPGGDQDDVDDVAAEMRSDEEIRQRADEMSEYFEDEGIESKDVLEARIVDHLAAGQGIDPEEYGGEELLADLVWEEIHD